MHRSRIGTLLFRFALLIVGLIWCLPIWWAVVTSVRPAADVTSNLAALWPNAVTFSNYLSAWHDAPFLRLYVNTILVVAGILLVQLTTITLAAYAFARGSFKGRELLFYLFLLQLMIAPPVFILPNFVTMHTFGLVNTKLAVMLPYFASAFGTFILRQAFKQIPRDFEDAAKLDGCNRIQTIVNVFIPNSKSSILAFGIVSIVTHWSEFLWPLIITNTIRSRTLTVGLMQFTQQSAEGGTEWHLVVAGTMIVIWPILIAFLIFQRKFLESFMLSGLKA